MWPRYFTLEWSVQPEATGSRRITGYVANTSGLPVDSVQILAQALDASGSVIGQRLTWVSGLIPPRGRESFRVDDLPAANTYRVGIWNFEFREGGDPR